MTFIIILILNVTRFNDQISHLHFPKISKYKIAKNSNTESKLQIMHLFFLGWGEMEDIRKGRFCWLIRIRKEMFTSRTPGQGVRGQRPCRHASLPVQLKKRFATPVLSDARPSILATDMGRPAAREGDWRGRQGPQRHLGGQGGCVQCGCLSRPWQGRGLWSRPASGRP